MKFLFFPIDCTPFHRNSLQERPLGGTETGIIHLSNALAALGHQVFVVSTQNDTTANPFYITSENVPKLGPVDVYVMIRSWRGIFMPVLCKKRFCWVGDAANFNPNFGLGDQRVVNNLDGVICVSDWHANSLCKSSGFPLHKTWILRNGVHLSDFNYNERRNPKRMIYTSQPNRGLAFLHFIFSALKQKHPELELHIFTGPIWLHQWNPDAHATNYMHIIEPLRKLEGCHLHGNVLQKELAKEYMRSAIWSYPTNFEETGCIAAMEAQAAGCAIVTSFLGALEETVGNAGILLKEQPGSKDYLERYVLEVDRILSNNALFNDLSQKGLERAKSFDWKLRAQSFLEYLNNVHQLK